VVTTVDLVIHPRLIVDGFGARCYLRCWRRVLFAGRPVTFLECIVRDA
jgi:hypothetical protein